MVAAQAAQTAASLATIIAKQNQQADQTLVALLQQAAEAGAEALAKSDTAPGTGETVDISA